jgi:hypothetical protein
VRADGILDRARNYLLKYRTAIQRGCHSMYTGIAGSVTAVAAAALLAIVACRIHLVLPVLCHVQFRWVGVSGLHLGAMGFGFYAGWRCVCQDDGTTQWADHQGNGN